MKISQLVSADVAVRSANDLSEFPSQARFTIVLDDDSRPLYLAGKGCIGFFPVVIVQQDITLEDICDGDGITLVDLNPLGIVVVDAEWRMVGVLPIYELNSFAAHHFGPEHTMGESEPSDAMFGGPIRLPVARIKCAAAGCGFVNDVSRYDRGAPPPCQNQNSNLHLLMIK